MLTISVPNSTLFLFQRVLSRSYLMREIILTYKISPKSRTTDTSYDIPGTTARRKLNILSFLLKTLILTQLPWIQPRSRVIHPLPSLNSRPTRQPQKMSQRRHRDRHFTKSLPRHPLYRYHPVPFPLRHRHHCPHPRSVTNSRGR
jgi:hypothetical protein